MKPRRRVVRPFGRREDFDADTGAAQPLTETLPRTFDNVTDEEIEAITAEIGATGARRPASE